MKIELDITTICEMLRTASTKIKLNDEITNLRDKESNLVYLLEQPVHISDKIEILADISRGVQAYYKVCRDMR